jgi:hypothetical protein
MDAVVSVAVLQMNSGRMGMAFRCGDLRLYGSLTPILQMDKAG